MTSPSPATQAKVNAAAQRNEQATYRKRRFVASIVAPPRKLRLNFSSSQKKIKKCRQNMFHQSGKIHKNTIFHIYIVFTVYQYIEELYMQFVNSVLGANSFETNSLHTYLHIFR